MVTDCIFIKTKQKTGWYVMLARDGKNIYAHRWFYERKYGKIPEGKVIDHLCRNKSCVNTEHLEAVTIKENVRRGSSAKLDYRKVSEIKRLYKNGTIQTAIATMFGVGQDQISRIVNGRRWS